ncbi:hypothetical protein ROZALSC1DRAFT_29894 [Rozella allomycis CSF55]|uniref:Pep3/Vps18 beta-propeller domain-containing protein n=1 Tax=Rozella allomycis (strain CSF55) TaxID=988480 RepID=A0A075B2Y4_ROZAC|nr:hypothetical protein O9G_005975 [Rozella allomycis CSF55]RKP18432.1 hypothetical protein ROZALSC1DRAFT_29894 [Rozella allomycis CSF55]|eukprot:EPZ36704.1 hypothetical protein O9G_005975 [Rozella allomycis CSF55]
MNWTEEFNKLSVDSPYAEAKSFKDIFSLDPIHFNFPHKLKQVKVCNQILYVLLINDLLLRIDLTKTSGIEEIDILSSKRTSYTERILNMFIDPTGRHAFFASSTQELYYLNMRHQKPKNLSKWKGMIVTAIAFGPTPLEIDELEGSTLELLVGTNTGAIIETVIEPTDEYFRREEKYLKQVYQHEEEKPILNIHYEYIVPKGSNTRSGPRLYWIAISFPSSSNILFDKVFLNGTQGMVLEAKYNSGARNSNEW